MTVFLTGATGLLGSAVAKALRKNGHSVQALEGDVRDTESIQNKSGSFDWVIHTAALTNVEACEKDEKSCFDINAEGTKNMCDVAKLAGAGFIFISTASVFLGDSGNYTEMDIPDPKNAYNRSKRQGELYALEYDKSIVVRLNVIGVHENGSRGKNFLEWLVDSFKNDADIKLFTDVIINPLSNQTLAEEIVYIVESGKKAPVVHLASSDQLSKAEIGKLVQAKFPRYKGTVEYISIDNLAGFQRPKQMWLNGKKTDAAYSFSQPTISEEIERIFNDQEEI